MLIKYLYLIAGINLFYILITFYNITELRNYMGIQPVWKANILKYFVKNNLHPLL